MNHGYEYDVNVVPGGKIIRQVTFVEPGVTGLPQRTELMRQVIDCCDNLTRAALIELGWTPPTPPMPPPPAPPPKCCLVKGCENHSSQGKFVGDLCLPCHTMLTTAKISNGNTFINAMQARLNKIASIAT
ncbi:MAG: hypothetical protein PHW66_09720 [Gallionella sp.]|nr:hypothetical protein [Gallionella sp.]